MDVQKKYALIKWLNTLSDQTVESFDVLRDGSIIVAVLQSCGDYIIPHGIDLNTADNRMLVLKNYLEAFYHQSFNDNTLINFTLLGRQDLDGDQYDLEMGKLLLAILGCVIQDKCREKFVEAAFSLDVQCQFELRDMIAAVLFKNNSETQLTEGFADVLTLKSSGAEGGAATPMTPGQVSTPGPSALCINEPRFAMYTNSPQGLANTSGFNIRDISSPLRVMSLSSPVTPLEALVHSPQFAQKLVARETDRRKETEALLHQKTQELRRLEYALKTEQHLVTELELDLRERASVIEEKDKRLREYERQVGELRRVRDQVDELESLRGENEALCKEKKDLHNRLLEMVDVRDQNAMLERENRECHKDLAAAKEELKVLESVQKVSEESQVHCHKLRLTNTELTLSLEHRAAELQRIQAQLEEMSNMRDVSIAHCNALKKEKEDMEEMLSDNQANLGASMPVFASGESMNIVTEKRLAEVQAQYDHMRASWIDPEQHQAIKHELSLEQQTKETYEEKYIQSRKKEMSLEENLEKVSGNLRQSTGRVEQLETILKTAQDECRILQSEVSSLTETGQRQEQTVVNLTQLKHVAEEGNDGLQVELNKLVSELQMSVKELELEREIGEGRRTSFQKELSELQEKFSAVEETNARLTENLETVKRCKDDKISQVESHLNDVKMTSEDRLKKLKAITEELDTVRGSSEAKVKDLAAQLQTFSKEKRTADLEIQTLRQACMNTKAVYESKVEKMANKSTEMEEAYKHELEKVKGSNRHVSEQCSILKEELQTCNKVIEKQKAEKVVLGNEIEQLQIRITQTSGELEHSERKVIDSQGQIAANTHQFNNKICAMEQKHSQLINNHKADIEELIREHKENVKVMKDDSEKIVAGKDSEISEHVAELQKFKEHAEEVRKSQETKENELKQELGKCRSRVLELEASLAEKTNMLESMSKQVDYLKDNEEHLKSMHTYLEAQHDAMKNKIAEFETSSSSLQQDIEQRDTQITELRTEIIETNETFKAEREQNSANYTAELETLQTSLQQKDTDILELKDTFKAEREQNKANHITELETLRTSLRQEIEQINETFKSEREQNTSDHTSELETLTASLQKEIQQKDTDIVELKETFKVESEQKEVKHLSDLATVSSSLQATIDQQDKELNELRMSSDKTIEALKADSEQFTANYIYELETVRVDVSNKNKEISELKDMILQVKENFKEKIEDSKADHVSEIEDLRESLQEIIEQKDTELSELRHAIEVKNTESEQSKADHISELKALQNSLQQITEQKDAEISELKTTSEQNYEALKAECEQNKADHVSELEDTRKSLQEVIDQRDAEISDLRNEINDLREDMRNQIAERDSAITRLTQTLETEVPELQALTQSMAARIEKFEAEKSDRQVQITTIRQRLQESEEGNAELHDKLVETESYWRSQCEELQNEYAKETEEQKVQVQAEIDELESKHEDDILKINTDKEVYVASLEEGYRQRIQGLERVISDKKIEIENQRTKLEEQRENYQQLISGMEESLTGEKQSMTERLSQLKCQYENMMETKERETKKKMHEYSDRVAELEKENGAVVEQLDVERTNSTTFAEQLNAERTGSASLKGEVASLTTKVSDYEGMISEANSLQMEREEKICGLEKDLGTCREELVCERGEKGELQRQFQYMQDRNDTLSAELSSQQQQLAAVEEEKRQMELQLDGSRSSHDQQLQQIQREAETSQHHWNLEKMELETQLQSVQKCFNAVKKSETELETRLDKLSSERNRFETRCQELEQKLCATQHRESQLKVDGDGLKEHNIKMNGQLELQTSEYKKLTAQLIAAQAEIADIQQKFEAETRTLREEKTGLEISVAELSQAKEKLAAKEEECEKMTKVNEQYNIHYNKKKSIISKQQAELDQKTAELANLRTLEKKYAHQLAPLRDELNLELAKNKSLANKVRTLEVQNDFAERKIREYKQELGKSGSVFLGDPSEFHKVLANKENDANASFMMNHPSSVPSSGSDSPLHISELSGLCDDTLTPDTRASRSRRKISKSISSTTVSSEDRTDTISIGSATSLAYRLRSRESAASLTSIDSCRSGASIKSTTSVPRGTGGIFHCEDEPMELEWGRLGELSRRNTMCPSHLKTSYPVETQRINPRKYNDDALRASTIGLKTTQSAGELTASGKKRKTTWDTDSGSDSADNKSKLAKTTGCVYQKPGPPTPANSRRNSKGSKSPTGSRRSSKGSRSPQTPLLRSRRTPRRNAKNTTPRGGTNMETDDSAKKVGKGMSFSVGFSPVVSKSARLTRQTGFVQKQPKSSSQVSSLISKFEHKTVTAAAQNTSGHSRISNSSLQTPKLGRVLLSRPVAADGSLYNSNRGQSGSTSAAQPSKCVKHSNSLVNTSVFRSADAVFSVSKNAAGPLLQVKTTTDQNNNVEKNPNATFTRQSPDMKKTSSSNQPLPKPQPSSFLPRSTRKRKLDFSCSTPDNAAVVAATSVDQSGIDTVDMVTSQLGPDSSSKRSFLSSTPINSAQELPSFHKSEHIYDEIPEPPYRVTATRAVMTTPHTETGQDGTCSQSNVSVSQAADEFSAHVQHTPSLSRIKHLNSSPDCFRLSVKKDRKPNFSTMNLITPFNKLNLQDSIKKRRHLGGSVIKERPVSSLALDSVGKKKPVSSLALGSVGKEKPVSSLALGSVGKEKPVSFLALGSVGKEKPVSSLTLSSVDSLLPPRPNRRLYTEIDDKTVISTPAPPVIASPRPLRLPASFSAVKIEPAESRSPRAVLSYVKNQVTDSEVPKTDDSRTTVTATTTKPPLVSTPLKLFGKFISHMKGTPKKIGTPKKLRLPKGIETPKKIRPKLKLSSVSQAEDEQEF